MRVHSVPYVALLSVICCALPAATGVAETRVGRLGILVDVHGYPTPNGVVVPLRGIAEWLGATVGFRSPVISIRLGGRSVTLKVGASSATVNGRNVRLSTPARVYGSVTCVPVRFVAEGLGAEVQYRAGERDPEVELMAGRDFVEVRSGSRLGRVIVHNVPPDTVAEIVNAESADQRQAGNGYRYGWDWVFCCWKALKHGYVWSSDPYGWEPGYFAGRDGFSPEGGEGRIWQRKSGGWRLVGVVGLDLEMDEDLAKAGVPPDVIQQVRHPGGPL